MIIIGCSTNDNPKIILQYFEAGANCFIKKPVKYLEIYTCLLKMGINIEVNKKF